MFELNEKQITDSIDALNLWLADVLIAGDVEKYQSLFDSFRETLQELRAIRGY